MIPDTLHFRIERHNDEDGIYYVVSGDEIALTTEGDTLEDALRNLREAVSLYSDDPVIEPIDTPQMSHVFISYCHEDKDELAKLVQRLLDSGFSRQEIWYDEDLESGEQWIPGIDTKLAESFAVIVLVTHASMESQYVTYEWSWAMGNGIPVVPLLFDTESNVKDVKNPLLDRLQYIDCNDDIPDRVFEQIKERKETPPDTQYISDRIIEETLHLRVLARVALWLFPYANSELVDKKLSKLVGEIPLEIQKSRRELTELLVSNSHAFTTKQTRLCRNLIERLVEFWHMFNESKDRSPELPPLDKEFTDTEIVDIEKFRIYELELLFSQFQRKPIQTPEEMYYRDLDAYLTTVSNGWHPANHMLLAHDAIRKTFDSDREMLSAIKDAIEVIRKSNLR